ncbi:NmrA family NAD(P)-binding protein [Streptomyces sp. VRA16 Mangrove soil]|uniref:NmrA family NAD(P)-binding protein n=1 Tax=Streptomyces sp. VRA16 Mangrove soil TaxID=2817434 RepID=UPI001A9E9215|nr:NmrA family NAD(P)-binding protein [Streptomyces sp. VRA16 Mangrove soil]MBO1331028.1 NmrA family NAD(P)-binding protein [Streptomyces sp. VRA16 Mangrove soil]
MILVTGATGNAGSQVVRALAATGTPVRALSRSGAAGALPPGAESVAGDLGRPETVRPALDGVHGLFLLPGYAGQEQILADARAAGVRQVVLLSSSSVPGGEESNAVTGYMMEAEAAVRASGLAWTFLRPCAFMSNSLEWADQLRKGDVVRAAFPAVRAAVLDPYDIGEVAARVLRSDAYDGRSLALSGPEALTPADRVRILGEALGRPLRFEGLSDEEARADFSARMPQPYVDAFFRFYVDGTLDESPVLDTVERVTGRPPRTFAQWAREHAASFM